MNHLYGRLISSIKGLFSHFFENLTRLVGQLLLVCLQTTLQGLNNYGINIFLQTVFDTLYTQ